MTGIADILKGCEIDRDVLLVVGVQISDDLVLNVNGNLFQCVSRSLWQAVSLIPILRLEARQGIRSPSLKDSPKRS